MTKKYPGMLIAALLAGMIGLAFVIARLNLADDSAELRALQNRLHLMETQLAKNKGREKTGLGFDSSANARLAHEKSPDIQAKHAVAEPTPDASLPGVGPQGQPEDAQSAAERRQREAGILEIAFANEALDAAATNTFTQSMKDSKVIDEFAGTQIVNAECRASLCRVAVLHKSDGDMEAFLDNIHAVEGFSDAEAYWQRQSHADGSSSMTLFVARQGHRLPQYAMPSRVTF